MHNFALDFHSFEGVIVEMEDVPMTRLLPDKLEKPKKITW